MAEQHHNLNEQLSAFMDGEASELEVQRLLKQAATDDSVRATWARYQLVSALMHQQAVQASAGLTLADRVGRALQEEAAVPVASVQNSVAQAPISAWRKSMARVAVAASVAVAVITGVQWQQVQHAGSVRMAAISPAATVKSDQLLFNNDAPMPTDAGAPPALLASQTFNAVVQPKARQNLQLERYMQYHPEQRAGMEAPRRAGFAPVVREGQ